MNNLPTAEEVQEMSFTELMKAAKTVGLQFQGEQKDVLRAKILSKIGGGAETQPALSEQQNSSQSAELKESQSGDTSTAPAKKAPAAKKPAAKKAPATKKTTSTATKKEKETEDGGAEEGPVLMSSIKKSRIVGAPIEDTPLTKKQEEIISSTVAKSEKMRQLHDTGMGNAQIARVTGAHYSFVYSVVKKYKETATEE